MLRITFNSICQLQGVFINDTRSCYGGNLGIHILEKGRKIHSANGPDNQCCIEIIKIRKKNTEVKTFVTPGNKDRLNSNVNFNTELHLSNSDIEGARPACP